MQLSTRSSLSFFLCKEMQKSDFFFFSLTAKQFGSPSLSFGMIYEPLSEAQQDMNSPETCRSSCGHLCKMKIKKIHTCVSFSRWAAGDVERVRNYSNNRGENLMNDSCFREKSGDKYTF